MEFKFAESKTCITLNQWRDLFFKDNIYVRVQAEKNFKGHNKNMQTNTTSSYNQKVIQRRGRPKALMRDMLV